MNDVIIDTNVIVVANDQNDDVVDSCHDACVEFIASVTNESVILLDEGREILFEYLRNIDRGKPYGLGARFLFVIFQQQGNLNRVRFENLDKTDQEKFVDFPNAKELAGFDRSDRKFAALAKKSGTAVTNATDSDWADYAQALNDNGIAIKFLCGCDKTTWFR